MEVSQETTQWKSLNKKGERFGHGCTAILWNENTIKIFLKRIQILCAEKHQLPLPFIITDILLVSIELNASS
jgi:hypothetical protein